MRSPFAASQKDLQAKLDENLFDYLYASFSIWDQARLTALSHTSETFGFCIIADRTIPCSGVPRKVARKNLLQQLSVQAMQR